jgi:hypothetical protein
MRRDDRERGMVMVVAIIAVISLVSLSIAMMTSSLATTKEYAASFQRIRLRFLAEAGVSRALHDLDLGGDGNLGTEASPIPFGSGAFWTTAVVIGNGTVSVTSHGSQNGSTRSVAAVARRVNGAFDQGIFAGNSSNDPTYVLDLGGTGSEADVVNGDVYSGQDILVAGDATVTGNLRAKGTIQGAAGETGVTLPLPDVTGADYGSNHDVDVAADFAANGAPGSVAGGGTAIQVPEEMEAHIFRKNPDDRASECSGTAKDDYFLEDPYEPLETQTNITISGGSKPGPSGNDLVYYIDGNLWLHSGAALGYTFEHAEAQGLHVTFVVKGNVYFGDDLHLKDSIKDGVTFVTIEDESVPDTGNIYVGDPLYGTLAELNAFLYAEKNIYGNNAGGTSVTLNGTLAAGNHLLLNEGGGDRVQNTLNFDDRIETGALTMPGLSALSAGGPDQPYRVTSSMEVSE